MKSVLIIGTGLIGASLGLALKRAGFDGDIVGWDKRREEAQIALSLGALTVVTDDPEAAARTCSTIVLATPVLAILDWMSRLAPILTPAHLVTDVGSTKHVITELARVLYTREEGAHFLPGHPMAGKESGGAALADAALFGGATWLFTPFRPETELESQWRKWTNKIGATQRDMDSYNHDRTCAWTSHLPQLLSTALSALLQDQLGSSPEVTAIGARALSEMTRLGASPYSMWRDVALTNTQPIADTLLALEQRIAHLRENLGTDQLRDQFTLANTFRRGR